MPICVMCHEDKSAEAFAFQSIATGERSDHCRECHAAYRRQHYLRNKPTYIENERLRVRGHRLRNRDLLIEYLRVHPCIDCGETDIVVLDFDHRDPSLKQEEVAKLAARRPWPIVLREIAKCDVRCASCHRKRTAEQFGWRRGLAIAELEALFATVAGREPRTKARDVAVPDSNELRACSVCHVAKPIGEYSIKNKRTGLRRTKCKACQRVYSKQHYRENRPAVLDRAARRNRDERNRIAAYVLGYLREHPCMDCGTADLRVLDFDHRDRTDKVATVNSFIRSLDWVGILAEIAKCDVRCANCHRRRTAKQLGWHRFL